MAGRIRDDDIATVRERAKIDEVVDYAGVQVALGTNRWADGAVQAVEEGDDDLIDESKHGSEVSRLSCPS